MTVIEHRVETKRAVTPDYSGREFTEEEIANGVHRKFIGGHWDGHGEHQVEFLTEHGLRPEHRFLDVGCGAFRAGRHFIDMLDPGNYYGVDANLSLMETGYGVELSDAQRKRLPVENLRANDRFDVNFGVKFDYAIAQSVFSHVSLNHMRLCLARVSRVMRPGGKFYVTFFEQPPGTKLDMITSLSKRGKAVMSEQNVFWYFRSDLQWVAGFGAWKFRYIGDWGHPMGQKMVEYTRTADSGKLGNNIKRGRRWLSRKIYPA